tara:strand:+ start:212 stop:400 length:189 start_codon:yes stop_codon:yes gene_type:complete
MKNKMAWIISVTLLCGAVAPIEANDKKIKKAVKEKKSNEHTPGCNCGGPPPRPPKFWWLNWK